MSRQKEQPLADVILDSVEMFISAVLFVIILFTFVMKIATVSGDSMEDTLSDGDRVIIRNFFYTPKQGDIVVVNSRVLGKLIVKRVIAVSGQKVVIDYVNDKVYVCSIDEEPDEADKLDEGYVSVSDLTDPEAYFSEEHFEGDKNRYVYTVPVGYIFVMGDNRNVSTDSRAIGLIDLNDVQGKAVFRVASKNGRRIGFVK